MSKTLLEYRSDLKLDLNDVDGVRWTEDELDRCVLRAVADLSRFMSLEAVHELTFKYAVTDEAWRSGAAHGTYVSLASKPIKPQSETVKSSDGATTYTRDTDYTIDYVNGRITTIDGGSMAVDTAYKISYTKSRLGIDISAIIPDLIRIVRVEYPVDKVPQQFVSYNIWNDLMYIGSQRPGESQTQINDGEHIAIYYDKEQTPPTPDAGGSYGALLDQVISIGAGAYALLSQALSQEHQATIDLASARTTIGNVAAIHTLINSALTNSGTALGNVSAIHALADTALDSAASALADAATALGATKVADFLSGVMPSTKAYLEVGDDLINVVPIGASAAENYATYAGRCTEVALAFISEARERNSIGNGYVAEASGRITEIDRYLGEADRYAVEATTRISDLDRYLGEADRYIGAATQSVILAAGYRTEGIGRRDEFWSILRDKAEYRKRLSSTPVRQPA